MSKVERVVVIQAEPGAVWRALTSERAAWAATMIEEPLAEPMRAGSVIRAKRRQSATGATYAIHVATFDAERTLGLRIERNGEAAGTARFELARVPEGTRVRSVTEYELKGVQRLMAGVVSSTMERDMAAELAALKKHVEARG